MAGRAELKNSAWARAKGDTPRGVWRSEGEPVQGHAEEEKREERGKEKRWRKEKKEKCNKPERRVKRGKRKKNEGKVTGRGSGSFCTHTHILTRLERFNTHAET